MKIPKCNCYKGFLCKQEIYPYIDVPMFGHKSWSSTGEIGVHKEQMKHNYCPQCGAKYEESEDKE